MLMTNVVKIDVDGNAKRVEVHTRAGLDIDKVLRVMLAGSDVTDGVVPAPVWLDDRTLSDGGREVVIVVDDNARLNDAPVNNVATSLLAKRSMVGERLKIHGTAIVLARYQAAFCSMSGRQVATVLADIGQKG